MKSRIDTVIDDAIGNSIVGCVVSVMRHGELVYQRAAGFADREAQKPVAPDTIFRLASVTKPIVATTALRMMEEGLLTIDDPVTKFMPWFQPPAPDGSKPAITIKQLLTHTSGLSYDNVPSHVSAGLSGPIISLEENMRRLARLPLAFVPGAKWVYGMGIDVVGAVLATIEGTSLGEAVEKYVTRPLGMVDTGFGVSDSSRISVAYADDNPPRKMRDPDVVAEPNGSYIVFSPSRIFNAGAPHSGGGGMAGTAQDILKLLKCFQPGAKFLKPETLEMALANHVMGAGLEQGRGFSLVGGVVTDPVAAKTPCSVNTVDWGGVYGLSWHVDNARGLTSLVCTNTALEGCLGAFPHEIRNAVFA